MHLTDSPLLHSKQLGAMSFKRNYDETAVQPSPCFDNRSEEFQANLSKVNLKLKLTFTTLLY